ncbi:hypothetical protein XH80_02540 [Bradyrhizobium sp. CCBAU 45384]|nr:hypothetical protein [Bradyrhizobium sp. CCBAU 45384]
MRFSLIFTVPRALERVQRDQQLDRNGARYGGASTHVYDPRLSLIDQEIVKISAASKLRPQPSWLPAATRPCLRWVLRIAIFGADGRVWTPALTIEPCGLVGQSNPAEPFLQMCFLLQHFLSELGGDLLVKCPEFVNRERIKIRGVHGPIRILGRRPRQQVGNPGADKTSVKY